MLLKRKMLAMEYAGKNERSPYEEKEKVEVSPPKPPASEAAISFFCQRQCIF
jgi:hypothetical protein